MKKKLPKLPIIIALVVLLLAGGIFALVRSKNKPVAQEPTNTKKKISRPVNIIAVSERPYIQLEPSSDGHYISINVLELKKDATELEYEMEYQTGSMLQGFQGVFSVATLPATEKKLFGSRSAGGSVTYHEDIKGGSLFAQFEGGEGYAVKSAWRYFTNSDRATEFSSQDTKFSIAGADFAKYSYLVIYNSPGYPGEIEGDLLSDIYVVSAERSLKTLSSQFTVSLRSSSDAAQIMGYDGSQWLEMETAVADGVATSEGPIMDAYLLLAK